MAELFTNLASSTLASGISTTDVSLTVKSGDGSKFPALSGSDFFRCVLFKKSTLETEIVRVTARAADVLTITRAQESTTAIALNAGDLVELRPTAAFFSSLTVTDINIQDKVFNNAGADTGSANTHVVTLNPTLTAYNAGLEFNFVPAATNTGAATIDCDAVGAKSIIRWDSTALQAGDILLGRPCKIRYDGTDFRLQQRSHISPAFTGNPTAPTPSQGDESTKIATTNFVSSHNALIEAAGTDVYTATLNISAYKTGKTYSIGIANTNLTSTPTINFDAIGAKTIKSMAGLALNIGEIPKKALLQYDGTDMLLLNPVTNLPGDIVTRSSSTVPVGKLMCDGSDKLISSYEALYTVIKNDYGLNAGITFTADATTDALTATSHGKVDGDILEVSSDTTLPAGLSASTKYFVVGATTNTFQVSLTSGGSAVDITDTGTGTHSFHDSFKLPDYQGEFLRGWDNGAGNDPDAATRTDRGDGTAGDFVGTKESSQNLSHYHTASIGRGGYTSEDTRGYSNRTDLGFGSLTTSLSGDSESRPRNINVMYCINY